MKPPGLPIKFLRWFCDPKLIEDVEGDIRELFKSRVESNPRKAQFLLFIDILLLIRPGIIRDFHFTPNNAAMLKNYLIAK